MIKGTFKIKLIVNMQPVKRIEEIVEIPYPTTMKKIRSLFQSILAYHTTIIAIGSMFQTA